MTVIAWDGKTLASDRMRTCNNLCEQATKISFVKNKNSGEVLIVGGSGSLDGINELKNWVRGGMVPSEFPSSKIGLPSDGSSVSDLLVIFQDRSWCKFYNSPYSDKRTGKTAIGSGAVAAAAVMHYGGDALSAVEAANAVCDGCGMGANVIHTEGIAAYKLI